MIIKNIKYIITMNQKRDIIKNGIISIENDIIKYIGNGSHVKKERDELVIDGSGMVAMPGLINTHTHSPMTLLRGYADDLPLMKWLNEKIWPMEAKFKPKDFYYGSLLACLEMICFGVTTFSDMYSHPDQILKAVKESGLRAMISPVIFENVNSKCNVKNAEKFLKYKSEMITPALGPHSPYACSKEELEEIGEISKEKNTKIHIHISETKNEVIEIRKKYGMTPVEFLDTIGLMNERTMLVHSIWVSNKEINIIRKRKSSVVHCPISNMKLASGVMPIQKMNNITVSLGSDGPSSNNNLDMFEEMKFTALLHKLHNLNPVLIPAEKTLEMATINGAKTLEMENKIGSIEIGKKADIILVDFKKLHLVPVYSPISHLVYSSNGNDVDTVICDGKILMQNRKFNIDKMDITKRVEKIREELLKR
ncbi:MAG: amidohydrolase [Candidatus Aenigmarchaeota archaeon]|nr:amidohydrolase [Candidatus Aenigmarchaeota archaeon]